MAYLNEQPVWREGVYQLEMGDPVLGGPDGISNLPNRQLADRTVYLKDESEKLDGRVTTLENSYSEETQNAIFGGVQIALDMAGQFRQELDASRFTRFQEINAKIYNRGIVYGVELSKSVDATRNVSCSKGRVFMNGNVYAVDEQNNTAAIPGNLTSEDGTAIIYMFLENGGMTVAATELNEPLPDFGIELARVTIPAGNTEMNDPYIENVTITETARREPGWPKIINSPAAVNIPLKRAFPDSAYIVHMDIDSFSGVYDWPVETRDKKQDGFTLFYAGNADALNVRMLVAHPSI